MINIFKKFQIEYLLLTILLAGVLVVGCSSDNEKTKGTKKSEATNTIMIYMVGSNLESKGGAASKDIVEMARSGIDFEKNNVVVYTGGSTYWNLDISTDYNTVLEIGKGTCKAVNATNYPVNMGEASTLTDFLNLCYENYKTDHYSLIMWDHGGGPILGFGVDELYDGDGLLLNELDTALANSPFKSENKLDYIGFDACLMGSVETASVMSKYAKYMVASQETEPGSGWDYSFLKTYNESSDTVTVAKSIIDKYEESININVSPAYHPEITLSCMDLSKVNTVTETMNKLFTSLNQDIGSEMYATHARIRENTKCYGLSTGLSRGDSYDLIDLGNLTDNLSASKEDEAKKLKEAIEDTVIYQKNNVEGCTGLSVYYPYDNKMFYEKYGQYLLSQVNTCKGYTDYVKKFNKIMTEGDAYFNKPIWKKIDVQKTEDIISLHLTEDQMLDYSSAYYTVFEKNKMFGNEIYTPVMSEVGIALNDKGYAKIDANQNLVAIEDSINNTNFICNFREVERNDKNVKYISENTRFSNGDWEFDMGITMNDDISVSIMKDLETGELSIQDITANDSEVMQYGKTSLVASDWSEYYYYFKGYKLKYDKNKKLLPYKQWDEDDNGYSTGVRMNYGVLNFKTIHTNELSKELYCQIVVKDAQGNEHASELVKLKSAGVQKKVVKTKKGKLVFDVYQDHAVLTQYNGKDKKVKIPEKVNKKPVTEIGSQAFMQRDKTTAAVSGGNENITKVILPNTIKRIGEGAFDWCKNLKEINLTEGIEYICDYAFRNTGLVEIKLPETLKSIGYMAFSYTSYEEELHLNIPKSVERIYGNPFAGSNIADISVSAENSKYKVENGYLCTKNGKELVIGTNTADVVILKGIERIGDYAFATCNNVRKITFADSVKEIGNYAFYNCDEKELALPDKLQTIGYCAFRNTSMDDLFEDEATAGFTTVNIPQSVTKIGDAAFSGQPIRQFILDKKNTTYSAKDNFLMTKNGEQLIACGGGIGGKITLPDSVKEIKYLAFVGCNKIGRNDEGMKITELIIPDNVVSIKEDFDLNLSGLSEMKIVIGKNVTVWKGYDSLSIVDNIQISKENTHYEIKNGAIVYRESGEKGYK